VFFVCGAYILAQIQFDFAKFSIFHYFGRKLHIFTYVLHGIETDEKVIAIDVPLGWLAQLTFNKLSFILTFKLTNSQPTKPRSIQLILSTNWSSFIGPFPLYLILLSCLTKNRLYKECLY